MQYGCVDLFTLNGNVLIKNGKIVNGFSKQSFKNAGSRNEKKDVAARFNVHKSTIIRLVQ